MPQRLKAWGSLGPSRVVSSEHEVAEALALAGDLVARSAGAQTLAKHLLDLGQEIAFTDLLEMEAPSQDLEFQDSEVTESVQAFRARAGGVAKPSGETSKGRGRPRP